MVEPNFVVCHLGKWGVLEVDGSSHEGRKAEDTDKDRLFHAHQIAVVRRYTEEQARGNPDAILAEFLRDLEQLGFGLANTAFLHEQPGFRPTGFDNRPAVFERVIDSSSSGARV
jgi:hypothetical protein